MRILPSPPLYLIRVVLYGLSLVLAGAVWAWAFGANIWYGVVPGAVLGLGAVLTLGPTSDAEAKSARDLTGMLYVFGRLVAVALLLTLSIVGAIVGFVIRLVP